MIPESSVARLRLVAILEGWSYLILVFIAMPLKYFADLPLAVRVVGMAHGVLFILFCLAFFVAMLDVKWTLFKRVWVFVSALIPFGFIVADRTLKAEMEQGTPVESNG